MRIGWREFIKLKLRKPSQFHSVGMEFGDNGVQLSVLKFNKGGLCWVQQHSLALANWQPQLKKLVQKAKLTNTPCYVALSIGRYQLLQVDRPQVEPNEVNKALTWSVKELLPNMTDPEIDYFDMPAQTAGAEKVNVVAIESQDIRQIAKGVLAAELDLRSISIEELSTCNLVDEPDNAVVTLLQEPGEEICLNIVKDKKLYFARRLRGYENLSSFSEQELQMGVVDSLSVEVQRSMDYFESQLRQAPVKKILMSVDSRHTETLANMVEQMTLKPVTCFVPNLQKAESLDFAKASYTSLGAAVKGELSENIADEKGMASA